MYLLSDQFAAFCSPSYERETIMKYFLWCLVWGIISLSTAFAQSVSKPSQKLSPSAYCEHSVYGGGFGLSHTGFYVDPDGNLYRYRSINAMSSQPPLTSKMRVDEAAAKIPEQKLKDYFDQFDKQLIRQIKPEEWQAKLKLLDEASKGKMAASYLPVPPAETSCNCFVYNEKDSNYQIVQLRTNLAQNSAPSAKELLDWMISLHSEVYRLPWTAPPNVAPQVPNRGGK
jgi:hypothetical protein